MLEKELMEDVYKELLKYNLVDDLENIVLNKDNVIAIDLMDLKTVAKGPLYAYYKGKYQENIKLNVINPNIKPTKGIVFFKVNGTITLSKIEKAISNIRDSKKIELIYGTSIVSEESTYTLVLLY